MQLTGDHTGGFDPLDGGWSNPIPKFESQLLSLSSFFLSCPLLGTVISVGFCAPADATVLGASSEAWFGSDNNPMEPLFHVTALFHVITPCDCGSLP